MRNHFTSLVSTEVLLDASFLVLKVNPLLSEYFCRSFSKINYFPVRKMHMDFQFAVRLNLWNLSYNIFEGILNLYHFNLKPLTACYFLGIT
ncbi:hypothetical protein K1719_012652 [Acacia pycnantha]|nr:hypothetical protein K1719_012652 [Acacia pycnantha]